MLTKDESAAIKMIEDFSLNAWPSHQIQYYDGWLLRFSYFIPTEPIVWNSWDILFWPLMKKLIFVKMPIITGELPASLKSHLCWITTSSNVSLTAVI